MIKPTLHSCDIPNEFKLRDSRISISIDNINYDPNASLNVFVQVEPPEVRNVIPALIANQHRFDLILAWHPTILENCKNSKRFIFGSCWIDTSKFVSDKTNTVSFLTSNKCFTSGHAMRHEVYRFLSSYSNSNFDLLSLMTPPRIENKDSIFKNSKFSIIMENAVHDNWITEKLIDCFATRTIPIYRGAPNVGEFFEAEGILTFNTVSDLNKVLNELDMSHYEKLNEVVESNYRKSIEYSDFHKRVDLEIDSL